MTDAGISMTSSTFVSSSGDGYEIQMGRWSRRLAPLLIEFAGIDHGANVLDVGCGTGNLALALLQSPKFAKVSGIDFSQAYIDHAARRSSDPRVEFKVADACALPFGDASFDHALSMLVLQFIPQADRAIREMKRVLRPGGIMAAATWDARGGLVFQRMFLDTAAMLDPGAKERRARAYSRPLSRPGELARAWQEVGLQEVVQDMRTIRMDFASFDDFWAPNEGKDGPIAEYVGTLNGDMKERLRDAVRSAYLDGELDGPRSYAATAWVVRGRAPL
jgi:ubiquinone/menaquinone biosynthesis C-methylase UbiE